MFVIHTSNCHGQNCTRWAIYRLGIDTLIANILVIVICYAPMSVKPEGYYYYWYCCHYPVQCASTATVY